MANFNYDNWAVEILDRKNRSDELSWKAGLLEALAGPGAVFQSVLEIGCAEGLLLDHVRKHFNIRKCYGLDVSETFLAVAQEHFPDITFLHTAGPVLPFPDHSIDLVIVSDLLEHISDLDMMMAEINRVGRRVLVKVPIEKYLWRTLISKPMHRSPRVGLGHPDGHLRECSKRNWHSIFCTAGFHVLKSRVIYASPLEIISVKNPVLRARWIAEMALKKYLPRFAHLFFGGDLLAYLAR